MNILDGKLVAEGILQKLRLETDVFEKKYGRTPHLHAIIVGDDPASHTYVKNKINFCKKVGYKSSSQVLESLISENSLIKKIFEANEDDSIDGIIVQLPLPPHINAEKVTISISPEKDVDGFHPMNIGKMFYGLEGVLPATPLGIIKLIEAYGIETSGKSCVVLGRSNIVGKPMSLLLAQNKKYGNCTVTMCHSQTKSIDAICRGADIIIAAIGSPKFVTKNMVKKGATIIDVGINRVENKELARGYQLCGDVDYDNVKDLCEYITPVPGGVGPMTVASLMINTMVAAKFRLEE